MQTTIKRRYKTTLEKRKNFLTERVEKTNKDLSFDKAERAALIYALSLIKEDIEITEQQVSLLGPNL